MVNVGATALLPKRLRAEVWTSPADWRLGASRPPLSAMRSGKEAPQGAREERNMAGSVNKVILIGNLGKDPEVRRLNSGDQVVSFSVATSETWRDKTSGERKERTEWHNIVIFNENLGKVAEQYCKKGTKVYIEGQLQTRKWQDQSGADKYTTEVVLQRFRGELTAAQLARRRRSPRQLPRRGRRPQLQPRLRRRPPPGAVERRSAAGAGAGPIDDDIPF